MIQVDHQEVTGTVTALVWQHLVIIFAENWPSMSFAVHSLGCLDITTQCNFSSAKSKVEFTSTRLGSTVSSKPLVNLPRRSVGMHGVTVVIQGSSSFSNRHRKWAENNLPHAKTLEVIPKYDTSS